MDISNNVGLFFGSFNPIHNGHMMLANYMLAYGGMDEVWFVVSPQNPLKDKKSLLDELHRLDMVYLAVDGYHHFKVVDIEFRMPKPSYTIDTLVRLSEQYPKRRFSLICGMDSLGSFHKWKNPQEILKHYQLLVYPRKNFSAGKWDSKPGIRMVEAPEIEVSSSFIRKAIAERKDIPFFLPQKVYDYILKNGFYL
jgi:nicotinate-nucleotide adenylyltransferase